MNNRQLIVMWIGIALFSLIGVYPPRHYGEQFRWKYPIFVQRLGSYEGTRVAIGATAIELLVIAAVTGGLMLTFKQRDEEY